MVDPEDAHVRAAPGAALLHRLGRAVEHPQEGDRARGLPAGGAHDASFGRSREKAKPVPPPDLWMMAADFTASKISSMESPTGQDVAGRVLELVPLARVHEGRRVRQELAVDHHVVEGAGDLVDDRRALARSGPPPAAMAAATRQHISSGVSWARSPSRVR